MQCQIVAFPEVFLIAGVLNLRKLNAGALFSTVRTGRYLLVEFKIGAIDGDNQYRQNKTPTEKSTYTVLVRVAYSYFVPPYKSLQLHQNFTSINKWYL